MPVFAPKSAILHHYFQKFSGWNKCTQSAGKCTISHEDFKNFPGVTPPYPLWGRAQAPCIFGPSAQKTSVWFYWTPLSKVAGSVLISKVDVYKTVLTLWLNWYRMGKCLNFMGTYLKFMGTCLKIMGWNFEKRHGMKFWSWKFRINFLKSALLTELNMDSVKPRECLSSG